MIIDPLQAETIKRCQKSCAWFLRNFGKIKHPLAGIIPFNVFSYQRRALEAFRKNRFNIFKKCISEGSPVWTPKGIKFIEELKVGDEVYSLDQETCKIVISHVTKIYEPEEKETIKIETSTGHASIATPDHDYYNNGNWKNAESLMLGDSLCEIDDLQGYRNIQQEDVIIMANMLKTMRHKPSKQGNIVFESTDRRELELLRCAIYKKYSKNFTIHVGSVQDGKSLYSIETCSSIRDFARSYDFVFTSDGYNTTPSCLESWNNESLSRLFNILLKDGEVTSKSKRYLYHIKKLLTRLGKRACITGNILKVIDNAEIGIISAISSSGVRKVYDISVDKHENFIVDGVVVHNCRQVGASKISGAFALWYAMFHNNKTILIVSRRNEDAMGFLREQVMFVFNHLPEWMRELWKPLKQTEHEVIFPNGSRITSLTSHPDVMRSNSSSLNIIDEAAFIVGMDEMYAAAAPTLNMGGSVIVISTTNGVGGWYWGTYTDAEAGLNRWNAINIDWWDMDWVIEYKDPLSGDDRRIAPRDNIRPCATAEEKRKYGPYWSPWLEEQYQDLVSKGESWKFEQEILAHFVGSGNTVIDKDAINLISKTVEDPLERISGDQTYVHPVTGATEELTFDFSESDQGLWIFKKPVLAVPEKKVNNVVVQKGVTAHRYVMGVDIATGKGRDYSAIEIFDLDEREQVAEFMARVLPRELIKYVDRLGRYYNCALTVIERNNGGDMVIDEMRHQMSYPRLWRRKDINDKPTPVTSTRKKQRAMKVSAYGFNTSQASKAILNRYLIDYLRSDIDDTWRIYSRRLYKQLQIYVRKRDRSGRDTGKTEAEDGVGNHDDLVMATALAFIASGDHFVVDQTNMIPSSANTEFRSIVGPSLMSDAQLVEYQKQIVEKGGQQFLMPMSVGTEELPDIAISRVIDNYTLQLGAVPVSNSKPIITPSKYFYDKSPKRN